MAGNFLGTDTRASCQRIGAGSHGQERVRSVGNNASTHGLHSKGVGESYRYQLMVNAVVIISSCDTRSEQTTCQGSELKGMQQAPMQLAGVLLQEAVPKNECGHLGDEPGRLAGSADFAITRNPSARVETSVAAVGSWQWGRDRGRCRD